MYLPLPYPLAPRTHRRALRAAYIGLLASLSWVIADLLLVGFTPQPAQYPLLSTTYASQLDVDFAVLMLSGSTPRLMAGALLATFTIPLYLYSCFSLLSLVHRRPRPYLAVPLLVGFAYAPLAHASFFYVGEIYKTLLQTPPTAHAALLTCGAHFTLLLKITWLTSLSLTFIGWGIWGFLICTSRTAFPRRAAWLNPLTFFFLLLLLVPLFPSPLHDLLACAIFNEAHFLFFLSLLLFIKKSSTTHSVPTPR